MNKGIHVKKSGLLASYQVGVLPFFINISNVLMIFINLWSFVTVSFS